MDAIYLFVQIHYIRCPVCGRVYQWKLLNHVSRDHSMSLKPAHLSYKCTVCTATFGMYKQFENHVYSAHSNVAKNSNKKPVGNQPTASSSTSITSTSKVNNLIFFFYFCDIFKIVYRTPFKDLYLNDFHFLHKRITVNSLLVVTTIH